MDAVIVQVVLPGNCSLLMGKTLNVSVLDGQKIHIVWENNHENCCLLWMSFGASSLLGLLPTMLASPIEYVCPSANAHKIGVM